MRSSVSSRPSGLSRGVLVVSSRLSNRETVVAQSITIAGAVLLVAGEVAVLGQGVAGL
jgi:hypothetical protein